MTTNFNKHLKSLRLINPESFHPLDMDSSNATEILCQHLGTQKE